MLPSRDRVLSSILLSTSAAQRMFPNGLAVLSTADFAVGELTFFFFAFFSGRMFFDCSPLHECGRALDAPFHE